MHTLTVLDVLPGEIQEKIKKEGVVDYRISSPLSLDDAAEVIVAIQFENGWDEVVLHLGQV